MASTPAPPRLYAYSGGFLGPSAQARAIRRILELATGNRPRLGWPGAQDAVLAWGHSPRAARAEAVAKRSGAALWRIEDAFIRSIHPGRLGGEPPMGLLIDRGGVHYDPSRPSDLEALLATHPFDDARLIARARHCIARLRQLELSKYNAHDPGLPPPAPGYVLVIDQVRNDASLRHGGEGGALPARIFNEMLALAQIENPGARVLIKTHPETSGHARPGHFSAGDARGRVALETAPHAPWALLEGAVAVYTVSSQLGFEAILAGHRPRVFGQPFYAGWGLTQDEMPPQRRRRKLTRAQLFAGAMLLYPTWHDPLRDRLCLLEDVIDQMEARLTAFRQDRHGHVACAMRLWKRPRIQAMFGRQKPVIFARNPVRAAQKAQATGRGLIGWASAVPDGFTGLRIEDGFLRSRGLGAALTPAQSLVVDDLGIYYNPTRESRLERLIRAPLPPGGGARAQALAARITGAGLTKY
ncbi:MAG TPA: capsular polysaccharide biosynthesis protein, partial [Paracoccus sp.]|nr:capsular polysaccharide biosynthesis protein [Paracoccus sp. (in: a-proteobacteria)]